MSRIKSLFAFINSHLRKLRKQYWAWYYFRNQNVIVNGKIRVLSRERIKIGKKCIVNENVLIEPGKGLTIGNNVVISPNTMILASDLSYSNRDKKHDSGSISIGDNVWIGAGCIILKDVTIGNRSVIGAGSVVTKSVPENVIVAGNPARIIKKIDSNN